MLSPLNDLKAPVFFVTGNHERYVGIDKVTQLLKETKVLFLRNEAADLGGIQIIGIDDSDDKKQVAKQLAGIKIEPAKFSILMYHRPVGFDDAAGAGVNLMLTGHTHNGQISPFNYFVGLNFQYMKGLFKNDNHYLYVSTGTGTWGPRMRLGSKSRIVLINLQKRVKQYKFSKDKETVQAL